MDICIIGSTGHINYVLEGVKNDSNVRITGIAPGLAEEDITDLKRSIEEIGQFPRVFTDYREMFVKMKPEVVVVASYFYRQADIAMEALKQGSSVFTEKPLATNMEDLKSLRDVYDSCNNKQYLAAMFGIRYDPWFMTAWNLVREGKIGQIRILNAQKSYKLGSRANFYKKRETYGGTIPWVGSHAIDWLYWFSGEHFESVYALHSCKYNQEHGELENTALLQFSLSNEVLGQVNLDYLRPETAPTHDDDRLRIAGTDGVIEVRNRKVFLISEGVEGIHEMSLKENRGIFRDFLRQVRGEGKCLVSGEDSFYITKACLKAREAADKHQIVYF